MKATILKEPAKPVRNLKPFHLISLLILIFFASFFGLASYPLANNNEGIYAEIAREMYEASAYIIPHLNYVPYLEKPPLLYWLIAASYHLFSVSDFAARLIPAGSATLINMGILYFGKRLKEARTAWLAAMVLASSLGFIIISRIIFFDMLLTACISFSLLQFYLWYQEEKVSDLFLSYFFLGLSVLTKGFLALVLVPGIALIFMLIQKTHWKKMRQLFDWRGILLFIMLILPWHILASIKHPGFAWEYFINEQVLRFLDQRIPHDYYSGPIYYYIPRVVLYIFPWSFAVPALFATLKHLGNKNSPLINFLWLWFIVPLIFFSLSKAKANYYMVISLPAIAYLFAIRFREYFICNKQTLFIAAFCLTCISLYFLNRHFIQDQFVLSQPELLKKLYILQYVIVSYFLLGILLILLFRASVSISFYLLSGSSILIVIPLIVSAQTIASYFSDKQLADFIKAQPTEYPVYLYQDFEYNSSLLFYLQRRLVMVDSQSNDLYYGKRNSQDTHWFLPVAKFADELQTNPGVIVFRSEQTSQFLTMKQLLNLCGFKQYGNVVITSNIHSVCMAME